MLTEKLLDDEKQDKVEVMQDKESFREQASELARELTEIKMQLAVSNTQLTAEKERNDGEMKLRKEQFEQQLRTVQEQFANLATKVLNHSQDELKQKNADSMADITAPLKERIEQLQQAIQNTNSETAKSTAALSEQLRLMGEQTQRIDATATRLTNVMRGSTAAQGSWGERLLTEILDAHGFRLGVDYDVQQTITDSRGAIVANDESGRSMRPDVILHYPNNEDVVIDSKMSIDAYYQFVNTDDEGLKRKYADDLVKNIRLQMTRLARKEYARYIQKPREAVDFVIMFVPNDSALQLALAHDPRLWGEAFERQVFITGQQNLMAILKIIQVAWRQYLQTENQKRVYGMAEELLKRVGDFVKRFDKVGKDIESLKRDYDDAHNKAYSGRQSIIQKANELKQLGVKENANLPIPETIFEGGEVDDSSAQNDQSSSVKLVEST